MVELHVASLNCSVHCEWSVLRISHVCLGFLSFLDWQRAWKIHTEVMVVCLTVFLSTMRNERRTAVSNARKPRCLEGSLVVFDSGYSGVCILVGDDHLPGKLPACKQRYFL